MSFNSFSSNFSKKFQELSTSVSQKAGEFSTNLPSLAQNTQRLVQEKLGQVTDISQLPQEYIELEKKVDTLKLTYQHFLQVSSTFENESYDYPKYVNESLNEFSKNVATKVSELSHATNASEAQNILISPNATTEPKTLNYALSKVSLQSSELFNQLPSAISTPQDHKTAATLLSFSDVQAKIAQERLRQDTIIQTKFNKQLREELAGAIDGANRARKDVQNKRLKYDVARSNLLNARPEKEASLRVQMEALEDEFAQSTETATLVMQKVLANSGLLADLKQMAIAEKTYFENSASLMKEFIESNDFDVNDSKVNNGSTATTTTADQDIADDLDNDEDDTQGGIKMSVDDQE
ncbi:similar to Saccharomyces cerevisiae YIL041W GVP36 BAR domain-containing protein that localizes to both early and late Golgi vesicles [Maudiozyma saulgeensis]|uniref:Similar to Saccharomyces cerevisiae YIL041W GVP36 BAR domain-containing protein that localizes to both early and late Golgi vesicles n=1 Tax=Maudiozyma saulgeensis TaxID=1789683 RepID=A0A1X7R8I3_9SACH|nr:similar to Saccharomyces cerevisiae YIL041W GVP36 BAR domain-containing protein that localizes to both early and late Golgi vesicles [Kazachstania saulgeensis]